MKIKRIFKKQIKLEKKGEHEAEDKAKKVFRSIISELEKEGICIFETPEAPEYYQKRKFVLPGGVYASISKDMIRGTLMLAVEHLGRSGPYSGFDGTIVVLNSLVQKYHLEEYKE